jgi:endonuclease/exonuclease/phosphatase family metal-dependent hydrolase
MADASRAATQTARVVTYNVHGFVGADGARDPERVATAIERLSPDLVALQEVELDSGEPHVCLGATAAWLADRLDMRCHFTVTRPGRHGSHFGNAVLSRHDFELVAEGSLPERGGEPRAVQWLRVRTPVCDFHLMNTHLGIWFWERAVQIRALLGAEWLVRAGIDLPLVICGDFNATTLSPVYRALARDLRDVRHAGARVSGTWPASRPLFSIDHMFVSREFRVTSCSVPRDAVTRVASDHLPLVAVLEWARATGGGGPSAA